LLYRQDVAIPVVEPAALLHLVRHVEETDFVGARSGVLFNSRLHSAFDYDALVAEIDAIEKHLYRFVKAIIAKRVRKLI